MYDIITTGSALRSIFVDTGLKEIESKGKDFIAYPSGYKIAVQDMKFSIGGGGINTAVGFSRMGLKTAYLGKIGKDDTSKEIFEKLKKIKLKELSTKWIYFASAMKTTLQTQEKLAKYAKKHNIKVAFNPSEYEVKLGLRKLKPILSRTDVLI